jgi:hypothetical protein
VGKKMHAEITKPKGSPKPGWQGRILETGQWVFYPVIMPNGTQGRDNYRVPGSVEYKTPAPAVRAARIHLEGLMRTSNVRKSSIIGSILDAFSLRKLA